MSRNNYWQSRGVIWRFCKTSSSELFGCMQICQGRQTCRMYTDFPTFVRVNFIMTESAKALSSVGVCLLVWCPLWGDRAFTGVSCCVNVRGEKKQNVNFWRRRFVLVWTELQKTAVSCGPFTGTKLSPSLMACSSSSSSTHYITLHQTQHTWKEFAQNMCPQSSNRSEIKPVWKISTLHKFKAQNHKKKRTAHLSHGVRLQKRTLSCSTYIVIENNPTKYVEWLKRTERIFITSALPCYTH